MGSLASAVVQEVQARYRCEVGMVVGVPGGYDVWAESWRLDSDRGPLLLRADRGVSPETAGWLGDAQRRVEAAGIPCCPPLAALDGAVAFRVEDATVTVRAWVEGTDLDRDDPDQVRAAGATLARLHGIGAAMIVQRPAPSPWHGELWPDDHDPPALCDPDLDAWQRAFTGGAAEQFGYGLVHGDFWADNILWASARVAAVIDWSEARLDVLVRELAWATWEFGHDDNYQLEVDRARTFLAGYREVAGRWESGLASVLISLMRVALRVNARYSLADPGDWEYTTALQCEFGRLRRQTAAPLLRP